jgi:hypothetical protein
LAWKQTSIPPTLGLTPTASNGLTTGFAPIPTITCTYNILLKQEDMINPVLAAPTWVGSKEGITEASQCREAASNLGPLAQWKGFSPLRQACPFILLKQQEYQIFFVFFFTLWA